MSEPHTIGKIGNYNDMLAAMQIALGNMNINYSMLDILTGYTDTGSTKYLAGIRTFSQESFDAYIGALCLEFVAVQDPAKVQKLKEKFKQKWAERKTAAVMPNAVQHKSVTLKLSRRFLKKIAKLSAAGRMKKMTKKERRNVARRAARARWHKPKLVEVKGSDAAGLATTALDSSPALGSGRSPIARTNSGPIAGTLSPAPRLPKA